MRQRIVLLSLCIVPLSAYDLPYYFVGYSNILAGVNGITSKNGWHFEQTLQYYGSNNFRNGVGGALVTPSPKFLNVQGYTMIGYQTPTKKWGHAYPGICFIMPYFFQNNITPSSSGITASGGAGLQDFFMYTSLQWDTIMWGNRPIFAARLGFGVNFPTAPVFKNTTYSPGNGCFYVEPELSTTLFFTPHLSLSTDWNYGWSGLVKCDGIQAGQAFFLNYSLEYEFYKKCYAAVNGYYLQQFTDSILDGVVTPGRRERAFSIGPGLSYNDAKVSLFGFLYFEQFVLNRTQGVNFIFKLDINF